MKKLLLLFFIISCQLSIYNCSAQQIEWQQCFGGTYQDDSWFIYPTADSGFIVGGYSESIDGDVTGNHGSYDYWVAKMDASGTIQWQKSYGGSGGDDALSIIPTSDGGYALCGQSSSNDQDVTGNHGLEDYWVVKIDSTGTLQWQKCYGGSYGDYGRSIIQTTDSGYFICGDAGSTNGDVTGHHGFSNPDIWCVRLDNAGTIIWQKCLGGSDIDYAWSAIQAPDGGFVIDGYTHSTDGDVTGFHGGIEDNWIVKLDSAGNIEWQKCLGGSVSEWSTSIVNCTNNGYAIFGSSNSNDGDVSGNHGDWDAWIIRIDTAGTILWQKSVGGSWFDQSHMGFQSEDGGFVVAGKSGSIDNLIPINRGGIDCWIFKLDSTGTLLWQKTFGGAEDDIATWVAPTADNNLIVTGNTYSTSIDVSGHHGAGFLNNDYWVVKITDKYNLITGNSYIDLNSNNQPDINEAPVSTHEITETNSGRNTYTYSTGAYELSVLDSGNFSASTAAVNYYNPVPATHSVYFPGINQADSLNDFAFQPTGIFNDLAVTITPIYGFTPGFNCAYFISYKNTGTTILSGDIVFQPGQYLIYASSSAVPSFTSADSVIWNFTNLSPYYEQNIIVYMHVDVAAPVNGTIVSSVTIQPVAGDANTSDNYNSCSNIITGSVDPNEITVDRDTVYTTELANPPFLDYIIRFQNTGTGTAFTVKIADNIIHKLEIGSFELVASSHPVTVTFSTYSRLMEFDFNNINLPDSGANEPASHGFIRYRIKPNTTLAAGTTIWNKGAIYFDYNPPVWTGVALTEIVLPTGLEESSVQGIATHLFPNPASNELFVNFYSLPGKETELRIFDLFGREVFNSGLPRLNREIAHPTSQIKIDISEFSKGIYFLRIKTGDEMVEKKFVKM